jgi:YesN/AraC family two-component response regulator
MAKARPAVLLIDDQAFVHIWVTEAIGGLYEVVCALDGAAAYAVLKQRPVAAIILDVVLEKENGLDLVPRLRALSRAPIVVVTAYENEQNAIRAANLQVAAYLKKPFSRAELHRRLAAIVPIDPIDHAKTFLDAHYHENLNAVDVADHVGISEGHLRAEFLKVHGCTPTYYLRFVRLGEALKLLGTTDSDVVHIARRIGFTNPERFRRTFTRTFSMTPSEYRLRGDTVVIERRD